ncbi:MAG: hypothetical protein ACREHE_08715 [Rhizomicrobium sp.]
MGKVPVGRTIVAAYKFLILRPGAVLGLGWLPGAFYAAAVWFCLERLGAAMSVAVPSSAAFNEFTAVDFLALLLASAILAPTAIVPFATAALGQRQELAAAHFVYGRREFRLSLALFSFFVVVIAVSVALAFAAQFAIGIGVPKPGAPLAGYTMPAQWMGVPLALWLNGAVAFVLGIVALFLVARFGFFLAALSAAEERVTLARAWSLSRGNFWRLAVINLALAVPVAILFGAAAYAIEGDSLGDVLRTAWSGIPSEGIGGLYRLQYEHAAALGGLWAVALVVKSALYSGASAAAYRAVALGEVTQKAPRRTAVPATHTEPEFEPAWAAAKAMADANPRWQPRDVAQPLEPATEEHALASEAAATTLAEAPEHAIEEMEPVAPEALAAEAPVAHELSEAEIVHAAFAQMPGHVEGGAELAPQEHLAVAEASTPPELAEAPPLDPAGAAAMTATQEHTQAAG